MNRSEARENKESKRVKDATEKGEQQEWPCRWPASGGYRLDKAEIVTYRESRVTFRGIMIH